MKQAPSHLTEIIKPIVEGLGYECVGIEYHPHPRHGLLRVYIDNADGILVDDCSKVSHQISGVLDVEDPIPGNYNLEISSPGADRLLFNADQFEQFIGSTVLVHLYQATEGRKKITGVIEKVVDNVITLREADKVYQVSFDAMSKAHLVPDYSKTKGGRNGK
jgi:ribosome maturation factor RimP